MTIRAFLDKRKRRLMGIVYAGVGLFVAGILIGMVFGEPAVLAISLPGFGLAFVVSMAAHLVGFRCPRCGGNLAPVVLHRGGLALDRCVCFCPYCGVGLDAALTMETSAGSSGLRA